MLTWGDPKPGTWTRDELSRLVHLLYKVGWVVVCLLQAYCLYHYADDLQHPWGAVSLYIVCSALTPFVLAEEYR